MDQLVTIHVNCPLGCSDAEAGRYMQTICMYLSNLAIFHLKDKSIIATLDIHHTYILIHCQNNHNDIQPGFTNHQRQVSFLVGELCHDIIIWIFRHI